MTTLPNLPGLSRRSPDELAAVVAMAGRLHTDPDWVVDVMGFETGPSTPFEPFARNPQSGFTGLIQFGPTAAAAQGTTLDELEAMSFIEQLPYVERYFRPFVGRLNSLEDTYLAVFWPAAMGKDDDYVVASQTSSDKYNALAYAQNSSFDRQGRGFFTRGDIVQSIRAYAARADGRITVPGASSFDVGATILLGAIAGAGVVWYLKNYGVGRVRSGLRPRLGW